MTSSQQVQAAVDLLLKDLPADWQFSHLLIPKGITILVLAEKGVAIEEFSDPVTCGARFKALIEEKRVVALAAPKLIQVFRMNGDGSVSSKVLKYQEMRIT